MARRRQYKAVVIVPPVDGGSSWVRPIDLPIFTQSEVSIPILKLFQYQSRFEPLRDMTAAETVTLDKWLQPINQRLTTGRKNVVGGTFEGFPPPESEVRFDSWFQNTAIPRFDRKRNQFKYGFFVTDPFPVITSDNVTVDKWLTGDEVPSKRKDFRHLYQSFFGVDALPPEQIRADSWLFISPNPTRRTKSLTHGDTVFVNIEPFSGVEGAITMDKWFSPIVQRHNPTKVGRQYHISDPLPDVTTFYTTLFSQSAVSIAVDKLFQYQSKFEALQAITSAEIVTLDKWYQPIGQPSKKIGTSHRAPHFFFSPNPIGTPADIVAVAVHQTSVPYLKRKDYRFTYPSSFFDVYPIPPTELVTLDKWFSATEVPPKAKKSQPYLFPAVFRDVKVLVPAEWVPPTQQPRFKRAERQYQYQVTVTDLRILESLTVDKWFKEINQPYFPRKNYSRLYPQPFMDSRFIFFPVPGGVIHGLNKDTNTVVGGRGKVDVGVNKDTGTIVGSRGKTDVGLNKDTNTIIGTRLRGKK